jgi:hypothetical protein
MIWFWLGIALIVALAALVLFWRPLRRWGGAVQVERARELFLLQRERIQSGFIDAAAATGKPRGLLWRDCTFENEVDFARDRHSRQLIALVSVTIQFEAVVGSDMEGLPAVGNLRNATAVFFFDRGKWLTAGKAVFNLNPAEVIEHFNSQYEPVPTHPSASGQVSS